MSEPPFDVLFFCLNNATGPMMAQVILNDHRDPRLRGHAAGPECGGGAGMPMAPEVAELLAERGHDAAGMRAATLDHFRVPGAPRIAFAYNVCPEFCAPICAPRLGQPVTAHWKMPGTDLEDFDAVYRVLDELIAALVATPTDRLIRAARYLDLMEDAAGQPSTRLAGAG